MARKTLIYFGSSTLSSNVYDGGSNINAALLKALSGDSGFKIVGFGTNLSRKVMTLRYDGYFNEFHCVRNHSDEGLLFGTLANLWAVLRNSVFHRHLKTCDVDYIMSGSDFWPDAVPAILFKLFNRDVRWIACFYLFAPKPWSKNSPYRSGFKRRIIGLLYWMTQYPIYLAVRKWSDFTIVTSEPDVIKFESSRLPRDKIVVAQGGVDVTPVLKADESIPKIPVEKRKYDACFLGRIHYQKGILELIDIWKMILDKRPAAKLAVIGSGVLEEDVSKKVADLGLQDSIVLLGFLDGEEKYEVFRQSRCMVHPATYDSGGMAAAEGMAWGLPGVSFDLPALRTYYPKGMVKVEVGNLHAFADAVVELLENRGMYEQFSEEARELIFTVWDWRVRCSKMCSQIFGQL